MPVLRVRLPRVRDPVRVSPVAPSEQLLGTAASRLPCNPSPSPDTQDWLASPSSGNARRAEDGGNAESSLRQAPPSDTQDASLQRRHPAPSC
jgi:hypothetical protein